MAKGKGKEKAPASQPKPKSPIGKAPKGPPKSPEYVEVYNDIVKLIASNKMFMLHDPNAGVNDVPTTELTWLMKLDTIDNHKLKNDIRQAAWYEYKDGKWLNKAGKVATAGVDDVDMAKFISGTGKYNITTVKIVQEKDIPAEWKTLPKPGDTHGARK